MSWRDVVVSSVVACAAALGAGCGNDFDALFKAGDAAAVGDAGSTDASDAAASGDVDGSAGCTANGSCSCGAGQSCSPPACTGKCSYTCNACNGTFRCNDSSTCTIACTAGATCNHTCDEARSCAMTCSADAQCTLSCKSSSNCTLDCGGGQFRQCDNNVLTCNTPCP